MSIPRKPNTLKSLKKAPKGAFFNFGKIETMTNLSFTSYPIRNKYEYYLPELQLFSSYNVGGIALKDLNIYTEPSYHDGHSDDHRFNTFHCNSITNHDEAWAIGLELISLLRGLVTIFW